MTIERALTGLTKSSGATYVEDVFSTYLYTGTGASQTITNGIDLSTNGGLVWLKGRSGATDHALYDTTRGATFDLTSASTAAQTTQSTGLTAFGATGFTIGALAKLNTSAATYSSWTFRKQPKFFDVVTYSGTGSATTIAHNLGCVPGMIIVKRTDTTGNWQVYHNGLTSADNSIQLNLTAAQASATTVWNSTAPTSSVFSVGTDATVNASGGTYVAYLYAASNSGGFGPAGTDSVVACGSFTTDASGNATVSLGWEPQYVLWKASSTTGNWNCYDSMRGFSLTGCRLITANTSAAESSVATSSSLYMATNATGFSLPAGLFNTTYIYLAIRRPMKVPTDATKVFSPITSSSAAGTAQTTGFPIDSQWKGKRATDTLNITVDDRLRGVSTTSTASGTYLTTSTSTSEVTTSATTQAFSNSGFQIPTYYGGASSIYWNFARAPGFFDVVCFSSTGGTNQRVLHSLGVAPELIILKKRNLTSAWYTYSSSTGRGTFLRLNDTTGYSGTNFWGSSNPTASDFGIDTSATTGTDTGTFVAYLFATCPGVSKIGSYTGTGAAQNINCGFTAGARFVLIKRTDSTGSWYTYDSARGINASGSNDPYLLLNSTAAEVTTTDYLGTYSSGFALTSSAPADLNASGGTYIYLAIA